MINKYPAFEISMIYQTSSKESKDFDLVLNKGIKIREAKECIEFIHNSNILCRVEVITNHHYADFRVGIQGQKEDILEQSVRGFISLGGLPSLIENSRENHSDMGLAERIFLFKKVVFFKKYFGNGYLGKKVISLK